jgi:hypothetical protein
MSEGLDWIADIDSSKMNVIKFIQIMSAKKPGKYLIGKGKSNGSSRVVGIYFGDTAFPEGRPIKSSIVGYVDH